MAEQFGVSYHSKYGAVTESQHVFIDAALRFKAVLQKEIHIFEMGFGTGLNALLTYLEAQKRNLQIHYTTVEAHPISMEQATSLNYNTYLNIPEAEQAVFEQMHQFSWNQPNAINDYFVLQKINASLESLSFDPTFDIVYYDAFAPNAQPHLWEVPILQKMYDALKPDGILVTYCAKGTVKRAMKAVGFTVERLKGPPGKREMTRAWKPS